jgi:hypothetical protein
MENVAFIFLIFMGISMYIVAMIILACALKSIEDEIEKYQQRTDVIHHINNSNTKVYNANPRYENEIAIIYNKKLDNADIVYDVQTQFTEYYKYISKRHTLLSVMQTAFKKIDYWKRTRAHLALVFTPFTTDDIFCAIVLFVLFI